MRRVRILGLCLAAVFAMTATVLVVASPALAGGCNEECKAQKQHEKEEAKNQKAEEKRAKKEEKTHPWQKFFGVCSTNYPGVDGCIYGATTSESYFQAGKVTVHYAKPVVLQGGMLENEPSYIKPLAPALNGKTIVPVAQPAPSLTEDIDAELLPEKEKQRYEEYLANGGSTAVTATIELAGPAQDIVVDSKATLDETGESEPAFTFPVMIHLRNKFLGEDCYNGSTADPIVVSFISGETNPEPPNVPIHGHTGKVRSHGEGAVAEVTGAVLVNNTYAAPGVQGCGIYNGADAALDAALELPSPSGHNTSVLTGAFQIANSELVVEGLREGGIPYYNLYE
ncbi:MAG TPA: hypothetical protein VMB51_06340 [Solirubrobacteraceae bacterium]|nr:hypothetical protein [Solirubrobacteraceae bacterium]